MICMMKSVWIIPHFRGGSWAETARGCGATCRRRSHPTFHIDDLGFRLARSI